MHGTIRSYTTAAGDRWEYVIELGIGPDGRRKQARRRGFASEELATAAMQAELTDRRRGQYIEPDRTTLRAYLDDWLAATATARRPHTTLSHRTNLRRIGSLAAVPIGRLQPHQVQLWVNDLATRYAPRTVRATHASLDTALEQAVRWGHLPRNPAADVRLPRVPTRREDPDKAWTAPEVARFLAAPEAAPLEALWRVLLDGQLRIGEARALLWSDLDLDAATIHVRRTLTRTASGAQIPGDTAKTAAGVRDIIVSPPTVAALRRHRTAQLEARLAAGPAWRDHDYVYATPTGAILGDHHIRVALHRAIAAANVPRLSPHGLRHTGATLLIIAGVPLVVVSRRLGHASIGITADVYAHVSPESDRLAAEAFARAVNT